MNAKFFDKVFRFVIILVFALGLAGVPGQPASADEPRPAQVTVWPDADRVEAEEWPLGNSLTLTIDDPDTAATNPDYTSTQTVPPAPWDSDRTYVSFDLWEVYDVQPGDWVSLSDGTTTKTLTVSRLSITGVDIENDLVYGLADPDVQVNVRANNWGWSNDYQYHTTSDSLGSWVVDMTQPSDEGVAYDIVPLTQFQANQITEYGDMTRIAWNTPNPYVEASPTSDWVHAREWPAGTVITMNINGSSESYTATAQRVPWNLVNPSDTIADFDLQGYDVNVGDVITAAGDGITKTLIVSPIEVTGFDLENYLVFGTGTPGALIKVFVTVVAGGYHGLVASDGAGNWTASFEFPIIGPGSTGGAVEAETDYDLTWYDWRVPRPYLDVRANWDQVGAWEWPLGATLTLDIDDPATPDEPDYSVTQVAGLHPEDPRTYAEFNVGESIDIQPGFQVRMTDGVITKTHTVTTLAFTDIDVDTNLVTGVAAPDSNVDVWTCDDNGCYSVPTVTADGGGVWSADFTGTYDIVPGTWIDSSQYDEDGDSTYYGLNVPNPVIRALPVVNEVHGYYWPMGATVHLTVDDDTDPDNGVLYEDTKTVEIMDWDWNHTNILFFLWEDDFTLQPGHYITMTDGDTIKTHWVTSLTVTTVDPAADTVSGKATPGSRVEHWVYDENGSTNRHVTADENGDWVADFAHVGEGDGEQDLMDIRAGVGGDVYQLDEDGDYTEVQWRVPNPQFDVRANWDQVGAWEWPLGATLTLEIDDPATSDEPDFSVTQVVTLHPEDPSQTYAEFNVGESIDIQPGFQVSLSDGTTTKSLTVSPLSFTSVDVDNDRVYGVADPDVQVGVWACDESGCYNYHAISDSFGAWTVDMTQLSDQGVPFNIVNGTWIDSEQRNEYSDSTMFGWSVPNPYFEVRANADIVEAYQWPMYSMITLEIDDPGTELDPDYSVTRLVDEVSPWDTNPTYEWFGVGSEIDIQPGFLIRMTDGVTTKTHTVTTLAFTDFNVDTNVVTGVAAAGLSVDVWTCDDYGCYNEDPNPVVDENGIWTYDFTGIYDIVPGTWVDTSQFDEDGDGTLFGMNVPNPRLKAVLDENRIAGFEWADGATITVTVDDPLTPQNPDFSAEQVAFVTSPDPEQAVVSFDLGSLELQPGMLVTMTDGATTKTHTLVRCGWTSVDYDTDVISGWGQPGMDTVIWAYNETDGRARHFLPNADGTWTASFAEPGDEDWETIFDVQPGMSGGMAQMDADQDATIRSWPDISLALNQPPEITGLDVPLAPVELGQNIYATVIFSDPDPYDIHSFTWDWGDGTTSSGSNSTAAHFFTQPGVYTISVTVTDAAGESDSLTAQQYIVIYDPDGGFVTGGGWINSPPGAYTPDPSLTSKATFGFVSKYQKGANVPTGNTEFQFHMAGMNFKSTSYDWLVIAGTKAQYKGTGTINGAGSYGFMLTAIDGTPDRFRIKIWDKATGDIIYDNMLGAVDSADPITMIQGGAITVHKAK